MAEVTSRAPDRPLTVDASADEWQGALTSIEDENGISIGVRNDAKDLYLTLVTTNESLIRQITRRGLTVWLDARGGKEKRLGIEFPLGLMTDQDRGRNRRERPGSGSRTRGQNERGRLPELPAPRTGQFALRHGPDEPGKRYPADSIAGMQVAASLENRTLVYELRVPLESEGIFALNAAPGTEIGVGLETPEFERPDEGRQRSGRSNGVGRPEGGPPSGGMGSPPGGGNERGGSGDRSRPSLPEPLSQWIRITLQP